MKRPRAFTITELLLALGVLGLFAAAATQLFHATFRVNHSMAKQQDAANSFESALAVMRADAWVAADIATPDEATAKLGTVTWTVRDGVMARDAGDGGAVRTWPAPTPAPGAEAPGFVFATEGGVLVLRVPRVSGDVRMISQVNTLSRLTAP